jgi:sec-independent protein translocase protein TatA
LGFPSSDTVTGTEQQMNVYRRWNPPAASPELPEGLPMIAEIFGLDGVVVLLVVAVVLFGGSRIPKLARSLGSAQKEFKQGLAEGHLETTTNEPANAVVVTPTSNGKVLS